MAYNKSKYVEAAQKLLNQGKVPQAINEYQHILKYEPKDQVTLMTIGELYIRQGETFQAIEYFERLAQIFVGDGFLTKAIAVYKRIAKLAPEEIKPLERLADLYVQQGVMSEARPLFLQLAEIHLKHNRQAEAVALLKKLLQAEPDNLRIQIRLADLYQAMGQKGEAADTYVSAAQRALARGDHAESEKQADKALKIDPVSAPALTVKARSASSQGKFAEAAQFLKGLPNLDKGGEQSEFLLDLYIKSANWDDASALALQVFEGDEKNFGLAQKVAESMLESGQTEPALALVSRLRIPMLDAGEHDAITRLLNDLAAKTPGRLEPLEWLVDSYGRTSDSFRLPDALAHLGDALAEAGQLERAKEIYEQLVDRQPESDFAKRKLNGVLRKMGVGPAEEIPEPITETLQAEIQQPEAPKLRPELDIPDSEKIAAASFVEEQPDEDTQKFIAQSLTDVDLFASYGLTQKAIGLLEAILRRAPHHTPTLEKLLDFVLGAGDDRRTAELAALLEKIHADRGDSAGAERFGELRRRFQRAAGLSDEDMAAAAAPPAPVAAISEENSTVLDQAMEFAVAPAEAAAEPQAGLPPAEEEVQEVDLSDEWASLLASDATAATTEAPPPPPPPVPAAAAPAPPAIEEFFPVEAAARPATPEEPVISEFEISMDEPALSVEEPPVAAIPKAPQPEAVAPPPPPPPPKQAEPPVAEPVAEIDLAEEYELVLTPETEAEPEPAKPAQKNGTPALASDQFLADLADEIDKLGIDQLTPSFSEPAKEAEAPAAKAQAPAASSPLENEPLREVFEEFRADLGEMGAEDEDLETHYNLGIAFREMGLLEEAISEFQKVAKANERGKAFRYAMQCCTLLGLAFMEKGQPSIAAIWYERALRTPGVDGESSLALRYDLGVAQESANDPDAALKSFSQVYAVNIDYRDVADRISALQKTTR
ncbi:MAG TPA: tetratricopeptide repeat protein [Candidatus Acidoferrum sp.]|nr:tetratricopeptide repeat protein [Candidatus Acidoferrum sp.]